MEKSIIEIEQESNELLLKAENYKITNQETYEEAGAYLKSCMELKKKIQKFFEPTIEAFKRAKATAEQGRKEEVERMNEYISPVESAVITVRNKCKYYEDEKERLAREEAERLRKIEEEKAEKERQRLLEQAEKEKNKEKAELILNKAVEVRAENIERVRPEVKKVTNLGIVRRWRWRIVDEKVIPREFLKVDEVKINKYVVEQKDKSSIMGVEVYKD